VEKLSTLTNPISKCRQFFTPLFYLH